MVYIIIIIQRRVCALSQSVSQCAISSAFLCERKKKQKISSLMVCWRIFPRFFFLFIICLCRSVRPRNRSACLLGCTNFLFWCASLWTFSGVTENIYFSVRNSIVCVSAVCAFFIIFFFCMLLSLCAPPYGLARILLYSNEFQVMGFVCQKRKKKKHTKVVDGEDGNF